MSKLSNFLSRNTIQNADGLPLVHTTRSYNIARIKDQQLIEAQQCKYFGEDLVYLFVGRPAYKRPSSGSEASYWELPCCFIFDSVDERLIERIFPFDSGAFQNGRYPDYINFMDLEDFSASGSNAPQRMISAFFGSASHYFHGESKDEKSFEREFQLGVLEAELKALRRLAADGTPSDFDDRRFSIEVQLSGSIDLSKHPPAAIVLPSIYMRDEEVRRRIIDVWKAEPITYEMYGLSQDKYDAIIYSKINEYYKSRGLV